MNKFLTVCAAAALMCAAPAFGQATKAPEPAKAPAAAPAAAPAPAPAAAPADKMAAEPKTTNSQNDKMSVCNKQAGDKKGDERKAFMKTCLSNTPAKPMTQSEKMSMCNKKTAGMAKDERSKAQSECMKGAS